jgi:penicillin-binding protein 1B
VGESLSPQQLVDRLNDLGYAERTKADQAGEFTIETGAIAIAPRAEQLKGSLVRVKFPKPPAPPKNSKRPPPKPLARVDRLELDGKAQDRLVLDAPMLSSIVAERAKRRPVALAAIPATMVQAVLAIEDRRYYYHPGIDPIRLAGAFVDYVRGKSNRVSGDEHDYTTADAQCLSPAIRGMDVGGVARTPEKPEGARNVGILRPHAAGDQGRNPRDVSQRGAARSTGIVCDLRGIRGSRLMFGKDVSNVTLAEAATIAGVIQSPSALSPFSNPNKCRDRRNVVLQAMADAEFVSPEAAQQAAREPLTIVPRALEAEAPTSSTTSIKPSPRIIQALRRPVTSPLMSTRRSICTCSGWRRMPFATA